VLLLDEPLGALDLKLRREMQIELKQIQRDVGITFVFVTHDQEEALTMSDRIAVFNEGRIEQLAAPVELYEEPASAFVAGFVGTSNLIQGEVARQLVGREGTFVVRPEKVSMVAPSDAPPSGPDTCVAPGVVREVVYLGASTHSVVALDAGATLTVSHQNSDRSIEAALERREQRVVLTGHAADVWTVAFSPAGTTLASGDGDWNRPGEILLRDTATWAAKPPLRHTAEVLCLAFAPDGKSLAAAGWDGSILLWRLGGER